MTPSRFFVQRQRADEGAPSLSLGYHAASPEEALYEHFTRYGGVTAGDTYHVRHALQGTVTVDADTVRAVWARVCRDWHARRCFC